MAPITLVQNLSRRSVGSLSDGEVAAIISPSSIFLLAVLLALFLLLRRRRPSSTDSLPSPHSRHSRAPFSPSAPSSPASSIHPPPRCGSWFVNPRHSWCGSWDGGRFAELGVGAHRPAQGDPKKAAQVASYRRGSFPAPLQPPPPSAVPSEPATPPPRPTSPAITLHPSPLRPMPISRALSDYAKHAREYHTKSSSTLSLPHSLPPQLPPGVSSPLGVRRASSPQGGEREMKGFFDYGQKGMYGVLPPEGLR